jgi:hypothetical protein
MKIRIDVTPDTIGQLLQDMQYLNNMSADNGSDSSPPDILSPYTMKLLNDIAAAAEERAVEMVREGSEFSEIFYERAGELEEAAEGGTDGGTA